MFKAKLAQIALMPVVALASSTAADYSDITTAVQSQITGMTAAAKPMILAALGAGLGIFAIFMLFRLGKRALSSATSSKG